MKFIQFCWAATLGALVLFTACSRGDHNLGGQNGAGTGKLKVVATTTMITDLVRQVGGDLVDAEGLMGVGVDPHGYTAKPSDADKLKAADVVFYNGLMLEGQIEAMLVGMKKNKKYVYAVTGKISTDRLLKPEEFEGHHDPHVWVDPTLWVHCLDVVVEGLSAADAANKIKYEKNGAKLRVEFLSLHEWAKSREAWLSLLQAGGALQKGDNLTEDVIRNRQKLLNEYRGNTRNELVERGLDQVNKNLEGRLERLKPKN